MKGPKKPGYDVGYGRPPEHTRFKKGESGNPAGRPKGSLSLAVALNKALNEKITVTVNGRLQQMSKLDAAVKGLVNRSVKGDAKAFQQLLSLGHLVGAETAGPQTLGETDAAVMTRLLQKLKPAPAPRKRQKG